ncbi:hypothetical protein HMPREF2969_09475 [Lactobacillus sp. HMSC056D05]|nr:hypothetical protein HMPREF2969_09475 [Lactobacillus sp. HMSC056D05]
MSEEKLYAVKNDEGLLLLYNDQGAPLWRLWGEMFADKPTAERAAHAENGHVVTLIEEPEKVVVSKEQAQVVKEAHDAIWPAYYITQHAFYPDDEKLIMKAFVNGYTVKKEKKYLVYKVLGGKQKHELFAQAYRPAIFPDTITWSVGERRAPKTGVSAQFSEAEIEHYGLQDCERVEINTEDSDDN